MTRHILCTVGTSLLSNRDDGPWGAWKPPKPDGLPSADAVDLWLKRADPALASAETNTLRALEHRPDGWERVVARLCAIDCVRAVRYDAAAHGGPA